MAGAYADPPGARIAYDVNGTVVLYSLQGAAPVIVGLTQLQRIIDENVSTDWGGSGSVTSNALAPQGNTGVLTFMFPVLYDIIAIRQYQGSASNSCNLQTAYSTNTTNSIDGTFTNIGGVIQWTATTTANAYRSGHVSIPATGVKALRLTYTPSTGTYVNPTVLHLYGKPSTPPPVLVFWHPTLNQPLYDTPAHLEFGDVIRGSGPVVKSFRVKNASPTLTATGITVTNAALFDTSPTVVSQQQLRYDGGAYAANAGVSSLAPNAISNLFDLKYDPVAGATLSVWSQRLRVTASGWS